MGEAKRLGSAVAVLFLILLLTDIAPGIGANVEASINAVMRRIGSALENRSGCRGDVGMQASIGWSVFVRRRRCRTLLRLADERCTGASADARR